MVENVTKSKHGGVRAGSGRKAKLGKTVVKRIPEKYWGTLSNVIEFLENHEERYGIEYIDNTIMTVLKNNY